MKMRACSLCRTTLSVMIVTALLFAVSCGSLDKSLSRISSATTTMEPTLEESSSIDPETQRLTANDELTEIVNGYMETLVSGDVEEVCKTFGLERDQVLYPTYDEDKDVFSAFFQNSTYTVRGAMTSDHSNYAVYVDFSYPDLSGCFDQVLSDPAFISETAWAWIQALKNHEGESEAKAQLVRTAFLEAVRRIQDGEFIGKIKVSDSFAFHANPDKWLKTEDPDFIFLLGGDYYINRFAYLSLRQEYMHSDEYVQWFIASGELTVEEATAIVSEKAEQVANSM
jgi:hypothetical protein